MKFNQIISFFGLFASDVVGTNPFKSQMQDQDHGVCFEEGRHPFACDRYVTKAECKQHYEFCGWIDYDIQPQNGKPLTKEGHIQNNGE